MPSYLGWFLSPVGLLVLATLDSTVVFFLPFANDTVVIDLAASGAAGPEPRKGVAAN